jgi:hypothetical protein
MDTLTAINTYRATFTAAQLRQLGDACGNAPPSDVIATYRQLYFEPGGHPEPSDTTSGLTVSTMGFNGCCPGTSVWL